MDAEILYYITIGIVALLVVMFGGYIISVYNYFVRIKNDVNKSWSNIDVLLKQRHDELPKLVNTCQEYMKYEQETLQKVMQARSSVMNANLTNDITKLGSAETSLRSGLGKIFALAENYPDLKANNTFMQLARRISELEDLIADRRELYNDNATINNSAIEQFPNLIIAKVFGFKHRPFLQFSEEERADVNLAKLFKS